MFWDSPSNVLWYTILMWKHNGIKNVKFVLCRNSANPAWPEWNGYGISVRPVSHTRKKCLPYGHALLISACLTYIFCNIKFSLILLPLCFFCAVHILRLRRYFQARTLRRRRRRRTNSALPSSWALCWPYCSRYWSSSMFRVTSPTIRVSFVQNCCRFFRHSPCKRKLLMI